MLLYPNLEKAMIDNDVNREQVAVYLGISLDSLHKRMRGEYQFKWEEVDKLSDYFEMNPKELFRKREEKGA